MVKLSEKIKKTFSFLRFRFQYLINYIIIGIFSLIFEVFIINYIIVFNVPFLLKVFFGFIGGVLFAFILNAKLNFKVPKSKNKSTFTAFLIISFIAFSLNLILIRVFLDQFNFGYNYLRFITATIIFMMSYSAHRKITFDFIKKVGIAIYLRRGENVSEIYSKVRYYSDFIHLDLVDKTFDENAKGIDLSLIREISNTWVLEKMLHIMSKNPTKWIEKLNTYVDIFIIHLEIDEPMDNVIRLIKEKNKKVGIALKTNSDINSLKKYLPYLDFVQVMGIDELGKSGKRFNPNSLKTLDKLNNLKKKYRFDIVFDGGVKQTNIGRINAKYIVSSSSLLSSPDPITSFLDLKTSARYTPVDETLKLELTNGIKSIIDKTDFIESGNIVGSFTDKKGPRGGISDIDIIIILDELTKEKYELVINKFEEFKKDLESNYGYPVMINSTFGPLKFDSESIVFHLMIYDVKSHKSHCENSPFTCYDWQRSRVNFKKPMHEIAKVTHLQPNNFFSSRRSAFEYLEDLKTNKISYREYIFNSKQIGENKLYKEMNSRDRIEFSYHITKFLITNFLKLYFKQNKIYDFEEMLNIYFKVFPKNKLTHKNFIKKLRYLKNRKTFTEPLNLLQKTEYFIKDFEDQFRNYFHKNAKEVYFIRHAKTKLNKPNLFLGQKTNPGIINPDSNLTNNLKSRFNELTSVYSSPLKRCIETINLLGNKDIVFNEKLKEIDYGHVDGKDYTYLTKNYPQIIEDWSLGEDPRFPGGENNSDVILRIKDFLNILKKDENKKILICTHNAVIRTIIGAHLKIPINDWYKINISHLDPIKFFLTKDNKFYIELTDNQNKEIFKNF